MESCPRPSVGGFFGEQILCDCTGSVMRRGVHNVPTSVSIITAAVYSAIFATIFTFPKCITLTTFE